MDPGGTLRVEYRHLGQEIRRPAGHGDGPTRWCNLDPVGCLGCATFGYRAGVGSTGLDRPPPIESVGRREFTDFALCGQT